MKILMPLLPNNLDPLQRAVLVVALLNLGYFFVEYGVGNRIASVSLFADSIDFLEDATINLLILLALGWSIRKRAMVGMLMAALLLVPGITTAWIAWQKLQAPVAPDAMLLSLTGAGALFINVTCALLLARFSAEKSSLTKAAFFSARNDAIANVAIIAAGLLTAYTLSYWPDLLVGIGIFLINLDAAYEVYEAAQHEGKSYTC